VGEISPPIHIFMPSDLLSTIVNAIPKLMATQDFREIEFGKADGKEESIEHPQLLIQGYLDRAQVVERVLNKSTFLVLGYKGSGKSALGYHLQLTKEDYGCSVAVENLYDFPYKSFNKIVSGGAEAETKLPLAWQWLFLVYLIAEKSKDETPISLMPNELNSTLKALRQVGFLPIQGLGEFVTKSSKASFKAGIPDYFQFVFESESPKLELDIKFLHLISFLKKLLGSIESTRMHYLIIDGLDEILSAREIQYQSLSALINEAKELNQFFRANGIKAKIIVLCRTDLFERLPHPNKNKIRQDSAFSFDWYLGTEKASESNLVHISNMRAALKYPAVKDVFSTFFPSEFEGKSIYSSLMDFTRHTPRDFLQLMRSIQQVCRSSNVGPGDIHNGIKHYSIHYFLPELKDELVGYLSHENVEILFNLFSQLRKRDFRLIEFQALADRDSKFKHIDVHMVMNALFECSAIGHIYRSKDTGLNFFSFKYRNRNMTFSQSERIILHKGVWRGLNLLDI
jgi:hypothetical protein